MASQLTTKSLFGRKVVSSKGKKIGKVRRFVFHPSEKRVVGFTVKRPDAALMFHRKDLFVALDGFDIDDDNRIVVHDDPTATDKGARKALDLDWDKCVIWVGMPVMTASGDFIGYIDVVTFDRESGAIVRVSTENGAANDALLGKRIIPASYIKGFRHGQGIALAPMGEYNGEDLDEATETSKAVRRRLPGRRPPLLRTRPRRALPRPRLRSTRKSSRPSLLPRRWPRKLAKP